MVTTQHGFPGPRTLLTPDTAVEVVLRQSGASKVRDAVDNALVAQVRSYGKVGSIIKDESEVGGVGIVAAGAALLDTDGDGIPDEWEVAHGLDPKDASDGMRTGVSGYANLEVYANSLVPTTYYP